MTHVVCFYAVMWLKLFFCLFLFVLCNNLTHVVCLFLCSNVTHVACLFGCFCVCLFVWHEVMWLTGNGNRTRGWRHSYDRYPPILKSVTAFSIIAHKNYKRCNPWTIGMGKRPSRAILNMWPNERLSVQTVARDVDREILSLHIPARNEQILKWGKIM